MKFQLDNLDLSSDFWMALCLLQSTLLLHRQLLKESLEVADAGVKLFRKSVEMWQVKLEALISSESHEMAKGFDQAFAYLKPQMCLPLWLTWAQWSEDAGKQEETEGIYKRAIFRLSGADSVPVKEKYLNWAYRSGGYKKARDVFKSLQENRPFSVDFFRKMIQFEKEQVSVLSVHFSLGKWISTYSSMAALCCLRRSHHNTV